MAREGAAAAKSGGADAGDVGPALSLLDSVLSTLIYGSSATSDEVGLWRNEMVDLFVKSTLTGGRFASGSDVSLFAIYLSSLSQAEFDDYVAPAIGLKLRASPDGALQLQRPFFPHLLESARRLMLRGTSRARRSFSLPV